MKVRGCRLCKFGDCMCHRITRWNNIRNIKTPADFHPGYRRKYLINIHGVDPDDHTSLDRWFEIMENRVLPYTIREDGTRVPHPKARYTGDDGYRRFIHDLEALKPKPVPW